MAARAARDGGRALCRAARAGGSARRGAAADASVSRGGRVAMSDNRDAITFPEAEIVVPARRRVLAHDVRARGIRRTSPRPASIDHEDPRQSTAFPCTLTAP